MSQGRMRLQTSEAWPDQIDRLRSMTDPRQQTWDLSPNDVAAITGAVARLDAAAALVKALEQPQVCSRCGNLILSRDIHVKAPEGAHVKCLVLMDFSTCFDLRDWPGLKDL